MVERAKIKKESKKIIKENLSSVLLTSFLFLMLPVMVLALISFGKFDSILVGDNTLIFSIIEIIVEVVIVFLGLSFIKYSKNLIQLDRKPGYKESLISGKALAKYILIEVIIYAVVGIVIGTIFTLIFLSSAISILTSIELGLLTALLEFMKYLIIFGIIVILIKYFLQIFIMSIPYIIVERPDYGPCKVFTTSVRIGFENFGTLAVLILSYIGWNILNVITIGIATIWTAPYMVITNYKIIGEITNGYFKEKEEIIIDEEIDFKEESLKDKQEEEEIKDEIISEDKE